MAIYGDASEVYFHPELAGTEFSATYNPGTRCPRSVIYICTNCRDEISANVGDPLPPQNHRQHRVAAPILWRLLVHTQRGPD